MGRWSPITKTRRATNPEVGVVLGGRGVATGLTAGGDVVVCRHVADAVPQVDALVKGAGRN